LDWALRGRQLNEGLEVARTIVRDRRSVGANIICTAGMGANAIASGGTWPNPSNPAYWSTLRDFSLMVEQEGLQLCHVVFCDTATLMPDLGSMLAHWERYLVTLGDRPDLFVIANQPGHPSQSGQLDPRVFSKPASFPQLLCARNNPMEDANPLLPPMDFSCYCCSRDPNRWMTIGSSMAYVINGWPGTLDQWPGVHGPSVLFEPWHARPNQWTSDPGLWRQIARSLCFQQNIGGNFYSDQCAQSQVLSGIERNCAVEYLGNIPTP
jgi:hypothetical protein